MKSPTVQVGLTFYVRLMTDAQGKSGRLERRSRLGDQEIPEMSYHQGPHELRVLAISSEWEALLSDFGGDAYAEDLPAAPGEKQAMISPRRGTGPPSRRRSPAGRAGAHPCSTPYSLKGRSLDPRPGAAQDRRPRRGGRLWAALFGLICNLEPYASLSRMRLSPLFGVAVPRQ